MQLFKAYWEIRNLDISETGSLWNLALQEKKIFWEWKAWDKLLIIFQMPVCNLRISECTY